MSSNPGKHPKSTAIRLQVVCGSSGGMSVAVFRRHFQGRTMRDEMLVRTHVPFSVPCETYPEVLDALREGLEALSRARQTF